MKDGFDRSVAEKMPRMQKKKANRPWNVDPVLLKSQEAQAKQNAAGDKEVPKPATTSQNYKVDTKKAIETIADLNSDFTQVIFEKKDIQRQLIENSRTLEAVEKENALLKGSVAEFENITVDNKMFEREIDFLNEQLEDADYYIQNMMGLLEERSQNLEKESSQRKDLEDKFSRITQEIQGKAKLDVKVSILERDLGISSSRVMDLESRLEEEYKKREPLEQEIVELKDALDRVHSSLAHIRLKAKREVYGS